MTGSEPAGLSTSEPLRLGLLGAARISGRAIIDPAHATGARLVAVAARDRARAEAFAAEHGIERVEADYHAVVDDPEVEAIYNPLANALHGPWNLRAVEAGKHVLTEKPFASNVEEAIRVRDAAAANGVHVIEAFHYRYHPLMLRLLEVIGSGEVGDVRMVEARMLMPPPHHADPRWDAAVAGGGLMDVGCYAVHALRTMATLLGGDAEVVRARGGEIPARPGVDAWIEAEVALPQAVTGVLASSMTHGVLEFSLRVVGGNGEVYAPSFVLPQLDDRLFVTAGTTARSESLGRRTSYTYQLEAFTRLLREGEPMVTDADDAVATMELIDAVYRAAGMNPREAASWPS